MPPMGSFKRALIGYRRGEVDAAIADRDARLATLQREAGEAIAEMSSLSAMVIERERTIRGLGERLREANERHQRSIASLESVSARLEEIQAQARKQATRIRMKALREAVDLGRCAQELADAQSGAESRNGDGLRERAAAPQGGTGPDLFAGDVRLEIGPLGDFSQLVGFEEAVGGIGASEISVERFSEGRATLSMHLDEPVELLRELEERAPFEFRVRRGGEEDLILDVEEDEDPDQRAA